VLLLFSGVYAIVRSFRPPRPKEPEPLRAGVLVTTAVLVGLASFLIRLVLPFGAELDRFPPANDLYLAQAPAWIAGFVLGVLGTERGWLDRISPAMSHALFRVAWGSLGAVALAVGLIAGVQGTEVEVFFGQGTWESLVLALLEGVVVTTMPLWLADVFRRRVRFQGRLMRELGRAAFAAFIVHQVVLVGTVLATRWVAWPPEVEFVLAAALAVAGSFAIGALLVRLPGLSRIV
jgi:hypothetical protein